MPRTVTLPWVLFSSLHPVPASVTVTTEPLMFAVAVQLVNSVPRPTEGFGGRGVNAELKVATIVLPAVSWPPEPLLVVNLRVQSVVAPPTADEGLKLTPLTLVAAEAGPP